GDARRLHRGQGWQCRQCHRNQRPRRICCRRCGGSCLPPSCDLGGHWLHGSPRRRQILRTVRRSSAFKAGRCTRVILRPARVLDSIAQIEASSWNALAGSNQPFLRHEFLLALEQSGCATARTGWTPQHLVIEDGGGRAVAALPLYRKSHSRGEFVFDFSWASAYAQHGIRYYPKLLTAVPFTPVSGPRLLLNSQ